MNIRSVLILLLLTGIVAGLSIDHPGYAADDSASDTIPAAWAASAHADADSESFTHWNKDEEIPANCAACHSSTGFKDFVGADETAAGVVDHPAAIGTVVDCGTCHNPAAEALTSISFPSGLALNDVQSSAQCMVCHQGRASSSSVEKAIAGIGEDEVSTELDFINIHYRAAAATLHGSVVKGGYEYAGHTYVGQFNHVPPANTCVGCHDAHSLQVASTSCVACHQNEALTEIRTTADDIDGDGDSKEGIAAEIETLHVALLDRIEQYSREVLDAPVLYHSHTYPYFFNDTDANGELAPDEATYPNKYKSWTPRLLKAAYNYQFVEKDSGAYAHNPKYVLQLLFDSIASLAEKSGEKNIYTRVQ